MLLIGTKYVFSYRIIKIKIYKTKEKREKNGNEDSIPRDLNKATTTSIFI